MSLHDAYARMTPVELAFPDLATVEALSARVAAESQERGVDDTELEPFTTLMAVAERVRALRSPDAPAESTYPFGSLLFHCVHFMRAGCPLYLLATTSARQLLSEHGSEWRDETRKAPAPPHRAGYVQLPQHLVWTLGAAGDMPESLDGIFWTLSESDMLHALPISGLRPDRPGFGALTLPPAPASAAVEWLHASVRPSGDDFSSSLPGAELDQLYAVEAAGEVLKLLARFFARVSEGGVSLQPSRGPEEPDGGPRPSALPHTRVMNPGA